MQHFIYTQYLTQRVIIYMNNAQNIIFKRETQINIYTLIEDIECIYYIISL